MNLKGKIVNIHGNIESDIILGINDSRLYDSSYSYMVKTNVFSREEIRNELMSINAYHVGDNAEWYFTGQGANIVI